MSLIDKICKTCQHRRQPQLYPPCVNCIGKDKWEVDKTVTVSSEKIEALQQENEQLRDTAKGSFVIVSVVQDKIKKYEEVLGKVRPLLTTLATVSVLLENEKRKAGKIKGAEAAKKWKEDAREAIRVIDKVMKG